MNAICSFLNRLLFNGIYLSVMEVFLFSFIKGTLCEINDNHIVIETSFAGFEIFVPATVFKSLCNIGEEIKIYTYFQPREDAFNLFGFLSKEDKEIFKKLLTVSGIGAKGALAILSVLTVTELKVAIASGDFTAISRAQGVGKKTAQKVILELKDKVDLDLLDVKEIVVVEDEAHKEALDALVSLGYSSYEAKKAIKKCVGAKTTEDIIKQCLKHLSIM